jgi:hypothetical protein
MIRHPARRATQLLYLCLFFGLLAAPLVTHRWVEDPGIRSTEQRNAAPLPALPISWTALLEWPKQADAYLADHLGERTDMVLAYNRLRYNLFGETPTEQTVFGTSGRLFLTSHYPQSPYYLIDIVCGAAIPDATLDRAIADLEQFQRQAASWAPNAYIMIVPSVPALYRGELPDWVQPQCPPTTTVDRLIQLLPPGELRDRLLYPKPQMLAAESSGELVPRDNFHWMGLGPETAARVFAEDRLGLSPHFAMPTREEAMPSDFSYVIPGIPTGDTVLQPDLVAAGVEYCYAADCFPELGPIDTVLGDTSRTRSPQAGDKKLLLISDSFGHMAAPWLAPYFGTIWHFCTNNLAALTPDQVAAFRRVVFTEYQPDIVLYLYHDGSALNFGALISTQLWSPASPS